MNRYKSKIGFGSAFAGAITLLLAGCGGNNTSKTTPDMMMEEMATYEVTVINATANQPLSPPAVIVHDGGYVAWEIGAPATLGLEELAESGSPTAFIDEAGDMALSSAAGDGIVMPGAQTSLTLMAAWDAELAVSIATMLVNTNDAYTGTTNWAVGDLDVGASKHVLAPIYDAGTEMNSESAGSVPGPAAGGEGFNADRDDSGYVVMHSGVVSADDGLASSALNASHRFDNGAMMVRITRVQ